MIAGTQEGSIEKETGWAFSIAVALAVFSLYMYSTKPACREGFTPLMSFGSGWYCALGKAASALS
jgi:hypothetical protein